MTLDIPKGHLGLSFRKYTTDLNARKYCDEIEDLREKVSYFGTVTSPPQPPPYVKPEGNNGNFVKILSNVFEGGWVNVKTDWPLYVSLFHY